MWFWYSMHLHFEKLDLHYNPHAKGHKATDRLLTEKCKYEKNNCVCIFQKHTEDLLHCNLLQKHSLVYWFPTSLSLVESEHCSTGKTQCFLWAAQQPQQQEPRWSLLPFYLGSPRGSPGQHWGIFIPTECKCSAYAWQLLRSEKVCSFTLVHEPLMLQTFCSSQRCSFASESSQGRISAQ